MMLIKKTFFLFFFSIFLTIIFGFSFASKVKGQECSPENSDEPSSLRPYPGDPCYKKVSGALLCGNDLIVTDQITATPPEGFAGCQKNEGDPRTTKDDTFNCQIETGRRGFSLAVDASEAELPIAGNTEDKDLTDVDKVNEYVSWYLNGVIDRTENWPLTDKSEEDRSKIINFSGPIRKLLPLEIQNEARSEQVMAAQGESQERHNQLVYCT